ncbi:pirin family protein, partial [Bacteroides thetaiotaomicron]|nr:pirin family protein [Bacteroides thetaiotaomicron]
MLNTLDSVRPAAVTGRHVVFRTRGHAHGSVVRMV